MSRIPTITEQEFSGLNPSGLDEDFLARLTACAEGTHTDLTDDEAAFESRLRAVRPQMIPSVLRDSLLDALGDAPFAVDEKIVLFNKPSSAAAPRKKGRAFRFNFAAAAAVALLGSLAAFMVPAETGKDRSADAGAAPESFAAPFAAAPSNVAPAAFSQDPAATRDEGVVWRGPNQPHRVFRRIFMDEVTVTGTDGKPYTTLRPRVEYVIIPEKID